MLPTAAISLACLSVILLPTRTLSNPYGYYGPYSRTRRDPAAWERNFGGIAQPNQAMPVIPNIRGNMPTYGGNMDAQGVGLGGAYAPEAGRDPSLYGINHFGQAAAAADTSGRTAMLGAGSHAGPIAGQLATGDVGSYHQLDNSGAARADPQVPADCMDLPCQSLVNCINVTMNGTKCCPKCIKYGCVCQGYQVYDCEANGFSDRTVPEGKSYAVAGGTTVCSCPPGGGSITCSFHDPTSSRCPELQPNCIKTFVRELDGCEECLTVGCTSQEGEKVEAGMSVDKPPCSMCYCPPDGGEMVCGTDQACMAKQKSGIAGTSSALESSVREIHSMGMEQGLGGNGYGGYNGYGSYPEYPSPYGAGDVGGGGPAIPPVMPVGGTGGASKPGQDASASLPGAADSQNADSHSGGMNGYGTYGREYGMGYQGGYGPYGSYGQGGQGYGTGNYLGYGGTGNGYGSYGAAGYGQDTGFPQAGSSDGKDSTGTESKESPEVASAPQNKDTPSQAGLGAAGYPYYNEGQLGSYGGYGSLGQQPAIPPMNGAYSPSESSEPSGVGKVGTPPEEAPNTGSSAADPSAAQGSEYQNGYMQQGNSQGMGGYPYNGYGQGGYYQQNQYNNMFSSYGGYPQQGSSEFGGYPNAGAGQNGEFGANTPNAGAGVNGQYGANPADAGAGLTGQFGANSPKAGTPTTEGSPAKNPSAGAQQGQVNGGYDSNYPYYPYDQSQYPQAGNSYDSQAPSQYQPVDPSLLNPGSPRSYERVPSSPSGFPDQKLATPTENQDSGTRKIRGSISIIHKNRHSHEKAIPTQPTTTSPTTTSRTTTAATRPPTIRRRPVQTHKEAGNVEHIRRRPVQTHTASHAEQVSYENVLTKCCYTGRQWALKPKACSAMPVPVETYSQICAVAQEKCCMETKEHQYCRGGIDTARSMAACDVPADLGNTCGANKFKTCCDCCAMGLKALGLGLNCDVKIFDEPCHGAYQACCQSADGDTSATNRPALPTPAATPATPETQEPVGPRCATDSECQQVCTDTPSGMACSCRSGYQLHANGKDCVDVNECVLQTHNCTENQFCLNREGSFVCQRRISCGTGYELTERNTCEDIDECALGIHNCFKHMDCENVRGSFRCQPKLCDRGFFTDATGRCIDINECRSGDYFCPRGASCINKDGSYDCRCPTGMEPDEGNEVCIDVDECELEIDGCSEDAKCVNTIGSFICREAPKLRCRPGYQPNRAVTQCIDVDECSEGTHTCKAGSTCINNEGGFQCKDPLICPKGLQPDASQRICLDINECEDPSLHRCNVGGRCRNLPKTFRCVCDSGYVNAVADDGVPTCIDVDECAIGDKCKYKCRNTPGSYECFCPAGYKLTNFGSDCEDVDECGQLESPCGESETCFNTFGSFHCASLTCPAGYNRISNTRTRSRCQRKPCRGRPRSCLQEPKQISFHNISLANGTKVDKPLFRMSLARSHSTDRYDFQLAAGNEGGMFKVKSSTRVKRPAGIVYTAHELTGPKEYVLDLTLRLSRRGRTSSFVSRLYIFVSKHDF